jgi:hypothetical protein
LGFRSARWRGGSYHPQRAIPGTLDAVKIILDLGFVPILN